MNNFILGQAGRLLFPSLLILSLIVLYRGHNLPGGGFIGGLLAACAFILIGLGHSMAQARQLLRLHPVALMGIGLGVAIASGLPAVFAGDAFMTGLWLPGFSLPLLGKVHLGTPLVFDVGVYLTVVGFVLHSTFGLAELSHSEEEGGER